MTEVELQFKADSNGKKFPVIGGATEDSKISWAGENIARLCLLYPADPYFELSSNYDEVEEVREGNYRATCKLGTPDGASFILEDLWSVNDASVQVSRKVTVLEAGDCRGFRSDLYLMSDVQGGVDVRDFDYLAPAAFYRHLDLDGDGVPNNWQTYNLAWAEDKLAFPAVMAYQPDGGLLTAVYRVDLATYDADVRSKAWAGERFFTLDTDIGSLGFKYVPEGRSGQVALRAHYPFYEGEVSYALDRQGFPWGAFAAAEQGNTIEHCHGVYIASATDFADACWALTSHLLERYNPQPVDLPYSFEEVNQHRLEFLNRFFYQFGADEDENEPAGYIVNQHPLEGETLAHVYEYGFTGLQLRNAYNSMRYGYENGRPEYIDNARKTIDFFRRKVVRSNGFCHAAYSADEHTFVSWYQGLLLPYSFAETREEQEKYLGAKTVEGLATIHDELKKIEGSYTLPMSEEAFCLLMCWELAKQHGEDHPEWFTTAKLVGDFFLQKQNDDGSWYRAVDLEGNPVRYPEAWFGTTEDMRKSTTYNTIPLLIRLHEITSDDRYIESAERAADFTIERYVDTSYMYGSILDHSFAPLRAAGPGMDNSAPMLAMEALLHLYESTGKQKYLDGAVKAGKISATWINLWDVPFPEGTTLHRYGFRSTGWSPAFTLVSSWTTDMSPLLFPRDFIKLAELTGDLGFLRIAELIQFGQNEMVSTPSETYGYAHYGLQTEGRVMTWYLIKDWGKPQDQAEGHEFGGRTKGEENKTAYPWIYAVSVGGYYRILDDYGTLVFDDIRKQIS